VETHESQLLRLAAASDDCTSWIEHCHAECCRAFTFRLRPDSWIDRVDGEVLIHVRLSDDQRWYYELHGARVGDDLVAVPEDCCDFMPERLTVRMTCTALQPDCLCSMHTVGKPVVCDFYTFDTLDSQDYRIQPACLYSYKQRLSGSEDDQAASR
jgi:hypothetical protein